MSLSTCVITSLITIITLSRTRDIQVVAADSFLNSIKYVFCSCAASFRTFFIITGEGKKDSNDLIYRILDDNNLQLGNTTLGGLIKRPKGCLCVYVFTSCVVTPLVLLSIPLRKGVNLLYSPLYHGKHVHQGSYNNACDRT